MKNAATLSLLLVAAGYVAAFGQDDEIDRIVRAEMAAHHIPGMAVAVIRNESVRKAQGYGVANVEHNVPVTDETIFQSGSLGKQFTAVAVMLQVEDGKIALDDRLPEFFPGSPPSWHDITVRHLLTHTSGIPEYTGGAVDYRRDYAEDDLVKLAQALPLDFSPGAEWMYSNTGYVLLGAIVRKASGKFYGDVLRERVFQPLGMKTARVISEHDIVLNRAGGYRLVKDKLENQSWVSPSLNTTADGALYLSLRDFIAWDRGLRTRAVLKPESWDAVFTPVTLRSGRKHPYRFWLAGRSRSRADCTTAWWLVAGVPSLHRTLCRGRRHHCRLGESRAGEPRPRGKRDCQEPDDTGVGTLALDCSRRAGRRWYGRAAAARRRADSRRYDRRDRTTALRSRPSRGRCDRPGTGARLHRRAQPLDWRPRQRSRCRNANLARHHHGTARPGWQLAVSGARLSGEAAHGARRLECRDAGRSRHHPPSSDG